MSDIGFKEKLNAALAEPPAPKKLVEDTVHRVRTMTQGKQAELRLRKEGDAIPREERNALIADGVMGRLALSGTLPLGADTAALRQQLMDTPQFQKLAERKTESILGSFENGSLMTELTRSTIKSHPAPKRTGPVLGGK